MATVVAPLLQRYDVPALDVKTTLPPEQNVVAPPGVIVGVDGKALTVTTVAVLEAEQTVPEDDIKAVTVYEADVETVLEAPDPRLDRPLLQKNTAPGVPDAVKTTLPPVQKVVVVAALIVGIAGCDITTTFV